MPIFDRSTNLVIRLARRGCTNRPFYHIVVMGNRQPQKAPVKGLVGAYDPMPNIHNERVISMDFDKLQYWMARGARLSQPVEVMLGLSGYFPIHPRTRLEAHRIQRKAEEAALNNSENNEQSAEASAS